MPFVTATELGRQLRKGIVDPVDLVEEKLRAIESGHDKSIFIDVMPERARAEARAARRRLKAGAPASAFDGVPTAWKDLFDLKGHVTTAGSVVLKSAAPATRDAELVAVARQAGLITLGTLNMTEFAYSGIGLNPHYGTPQNPHAKDGQRAPGGSSSGTAVAVASGLLPMAVGTDTGGSVRIPAAFNGIVGYKSSTGHYPMAGIFPLARTLDSLGPLAHTVEDCVLFDAIARGLKRPKVKQGQAKGMRILVPENVVLDDLDDAVRENFEGSLDRLAKAGAKLKRVRFAPFDKLVALLDKHGQLSSPQALHVHWDRVHGPDAEKMDRRVVRRILMARQMSGVDLFALLEGQKQSIAEAEAIMGSDFIAMPATPHVAPLNAPLEADEEEFFRVNRKTLRNTNLGNLLDWCGVAIPNGADAGGMPTSFLLSAVHDRDDHLLSAAWTAEAIIRG